MDHLGAWVKCNCGDAECRLEYPSGLGKFYQGTGFEPEEKELIIKAFAALALEANVYAALTASGYSVVKHIRRDRPPLVVGDDTPLVAPSQVEGRE